METTGIVGVILGLYRGYNLGIMEKKIESTIIEHKGGTCGLLRGLQQKLQESFS